MIFAHGAMSAVQGRTVTSGRQGLSLRRMGEVNFDALDLNLLRVFDALFVEGSTTRAGERLHLSQSAISHALARLRHILKDELFIRSGTGMAPTALSLDIGPPVHQLLSQLRSTL